MLRAGRRQVGMTQPITTERRVHIIQGEFFVSDDPNIIATTILGSCVAACVRDPIAGVGGINHFLLPGKEPTSAIKFVGGDTGGDLGRRIQYWPVSGRARQVLLSDRATKTQLNKKIAIPVVQNAGELELF